MKTGIVTPGWILAMMLGAVAAYVTWALAQGRPVPLVGSPRAAVYAVAAIGFVMCSVHGIGAGMRYTGGSWASPFLIGGAVLGSLALLIVVAAATGLRVPMLAGDREMLLAMAGLVGMKFVLTAAHTVTYALAR